MFLLDKLLNVATRVFAQYGIRQMTMDDVSRACGISKKTLYGQFDNKTQLVNFTVSQILEKLQIDYEQNRTVSKNAIDETLKLIVYFENACKIISYRMLLDLEKYYYDTWLKV